MIIYNDQFLKSKLSKGMTPKIFYPCFMDYRSSFQHYFENLEFYIGKLRNELIKLSQDSSSFPSLLDSYEQYVLEKYIKEDEIIGTIFISNCRFCIYDSDKFMQVYSVPWYHKNLVFPEKKIIGTIFLPKRMVDEIIESDPLQIFENDKLLIKNYRSIMTILMDLFFLNMKKPFEYNCIKNQLVLVLNGSNFEDRIFYKLYQLHILASLVYFFQMDLYMFQKYCEIDSHYYHWMSRYLSQEDYQTIWQDIRNHDFKDLLEFTFC